MVAILVVFTILCCIGVDAVIQFSRAKKAREKVAPGVAPLAGFTLSGVTMPEGLFMDPAHTWVAVHRNGKTEVGVDQFLLKAIGTINEVISPVPGKEVHRGETLFTVRQGERKIDMPSPIDGVVEKVNEQVIADPEILKTQPYRQWICSVAPLRLAQDLKLLSIGQDAVQWMRDEIERFQEFISVRPAKHLELGTVMQDGGLPTDGVLTIMDNETWNLFAFEFVRIHAVR